MTEIAERRMTIAEFLDWDGGPKVRYQLLDGRPVAMAPVSGSHSIIAAKFAAALTSRLPRPCYVAVEVGVPSPLGNDTYFEADLVVSCTPYDRAQRVIPAPVIIVEVLSPTTEEIDRGRKTRDYRQIDSVQAIVLVGSEQRHLEVWRRRGAKWEIEDLIGDAALDLDLLGEAIPLALIYADSGL